MSRKPRNIPCSRITRAGRPCRAWAVEGTDPPLCSAHAGRNVGAGGTPGNQNARTHGFYGRIFSEAELADLLLYAGDISLDDEIACVRVALRRTLDFIRDERSELAPSTLLQAIALVFQGARAVARLLVQRQILAACAADSFEHVINQILDEIDEEWHIDL